MRILHYTLGPPPYRTGGLTKYSFDLMLEQLNLNNKVYLLYPGSYIFRKKSRIKKVSTKCSIDIYELHNPQPVPLLGGIGIPDKFCGNMDKEIYIEFLDKIKPDIIHIHTLMGIHKSFFEAAKILGIKIIYTTHDYFGICPRVNLVNNKGEFCEDYKNGENCIECNKNSYSLKLIYIMQSNIYRVLKCKGLISKMKKTISKFQHFRPNKVKEEEFKQIDINKSKEYIKLRKYYYDILENVDYFHFNSSVSEQEYKNKIKNIKGEVINISHLDILDKRMIKKYDKESNINILYLGAAENYKGFYCLKDSLEDLKINNFKNWKLNIYGSEGTNLFLDERYYKFNGKYDYDDLDEIFNNTDLLIIPSICKETFGFVGLEALSRAIPVLVSSTVGFKDVIVNNKTGIIYDKDKDELMSNIKKILEDKEVLKYINREICNSEFSYTMKFHVEEIMKLYKKIIEERV